MIANEDSDETLVSCCVRGDAAAFDLLYKRHELRIWRYLERNVRNQATSDELLQEVWCTLARNAPSLESATRFRTRLFSLAYDRMTTSLRARPPQAGTDSGTSTNSLDQAIGQLPREQREAYLLHVEGQLSVGEIAEITESSIDTTQNALRGARLKLRELLNEPT
jgi:DNA-directed RNA polymerase specialized sigma24 family protein